MFPLQPRDELVFGPPSSPHRCNNTISSDQITDLVLAEYGADLNGSITKNKKQIALGNIPETKRKRGDQELNMKRVLHRENERQRRHEMSNLYSSLRSLLPVEYVKGKRSVSDHMQEAVTYIKHMQKNVQDLKTRRDELSSSSGPKFESNSSDSDHSNLVNNYVVVTSVGDGIDILISSSCRSFGCRVSRVLEELQARELDVVSCFSTKENENRFLHKIMAVVATDAKPINMWELQEILTSLIN